MGEAWEVHLQPTGPCPRLIDCPCPMLSRVARLAKVDVTQSFPCPTCAVYTILLRFPTYVGQVGAKANQRKRPPMRRQRDHFKKARQLQGNYMGRRARNLRSTPFFGKCPILPELLACDGTQACAMILLPETPPAWPPEYNRAQVGTVAGPLF